MKKGRDQEKVYIKVKVVVELTTQKRGRPASGESSDRSAYSSRKTARKPPARKEKPAVDNTFQETQETLYKQALDDFGDAFDVNPDEHSWADPRGSCDAS